jgi:hypothetical protein
VDSLGLVVGKATSEHVTLTILRRERPDATDYDDGNWLNAEVRLAAGGFKAGFAATVRSDELADFRQELAELIATEKGAAVFSTTEEQRLIALEADGRGHITVTGEARDMAGTGNLLAFTVPELDLSELPALLRTLDGILAVHPVVGSPAA